MHNNYMHINMFSTCIHARKHTYLLAIYVGSTYFIKCTHLNLQIYIQTFRNISICALI